MVPWDGHEGGRRCQRFVLPKSFFVILVITFMHVIYSYVLETNHVASAYSVVAVLYLQSVLHVMLFPILILYGPCIIL